jgi:selenocysteine-specific elongation factor
MSATNYILATAGHVDHGKSALVKALTGTDPDRLPEEKARGITIELGFAHLELSSFHLGIVDVPGHEDFVKNMVAGVGSVDLALLVVAADDGWMPQSEEHMQILQYMGVTRAVIALAKIDLIESSEQRAIDSVRKALADSPFAAAPIIPASVVTGRGIAELKAALAGVLAGTPPPMDFGKPRLSIDRAFSLRGIGTVVTGTLAGGSLTRNQAVVLQPSGKSTRIRSIQTHHREVESAGPGTRAALNLVDVVVSESLTGAGRAEAVLRGDVVAQPRGGAAHDTFDVLLEKSARLIGSSTLAARPLKNGALVRVHHGTRNVPGRVVLLDKAELAPGEKQLAQIRCQAPLFMFIGDRFIIRDWSEQATLGGGTILDAEAKRKFFHSPAQRILLQKRALNPGDVSTAVQTQLERAGIAVQSNLLLMANFSAVEISRAIDQQRAAGKAVVLGDLVAGAGWWKLLCQRAVELIEAHHQAHPEQAGLALSQLRSALKAWLFIPDTFNALLAELAKEGCVQSGSVIQSQKHRPALPPHLEAIGKNLRAALAAKPLDPPSRKELAPGPAAQQALRFLIQNGEAVELGADIVLLADSFTRAREKVRHYLRDHGAATVSELRQSLGASRRIVVPLLEKLDRDGVTRREGDKRVLRS